MKYSELFNKLWETVQRLEIENCEISEGDEDIICCYMDSDFYELTVAASGSFIIYKVFQNETYSMDTLEELTEFLKAEKFN